MVSSKVAFLCLAHNNFDYLCKASRYYCSDGDELFLHVDSAVELDDKLLFEQGTTILKSNERFRTAWGTFNIVRATIALLKKALSTGQFDHFILISGADLPLLSKTELKTKLLSKHSYFSVWHEVTQSNNQNNSAIQAEFFKRHHYQHRLTNPGFAYLSKSKAKIYRMLLLNKFIRFLPLSTKFTFNTFIKGSQWWCMSDELAHYVCHEYNKKSVLKQFVNMHAPDEKMLQTLAFNSPFNTDKNPKIQIDYGQDSLKQGVHYIDWGYQKSKVALQEFALSDVDKAKHVGCLFARKITSSSNGQYDAYLESLISVKAV